LRISHLRIICFPFASCYSCFQTSRAGRIAILDVLRRCVRCLMMTGLLSMFSTFGRFVSLWTTNARLESYSFLSGFLCSKNSLLENPSFPDDLSSVFLIFIILSDSFCCEMNLPFVASCDSASTHPPFLASSRPPKNLRNEPWSVYYVKQINSILKS